MSVIDVREDDNRVVDTVVFANSHCSEGDGQAYRIENCHGYVFLADPDDMLVINSKQHAQDLIKALNKAIELGWLT